MTSSRYEASIDRSNPNRVVVIDRHEGHHKVVDFTDEQGDALVEWMSGFLAAGVERYGSVDGFTRALGWYNDAHRTEHAA